MKFSYLSGLFATCLIVQAGTSNAFEEKDFRYQDLRINKDTSHEKFRWDPPIRTDAKAGEIFCGFKVKSNPTITNAVVEVWDLSPSSAVFGADIGSPQYEGHLHIDFTARFAKVGAENTQKYSSSNEGLKIWHAECSNSEWQVDHVHIGAFQTVTGDYTGCIPPLAYKNGRVVAFCSP